MDEFLATRKIRNILKISYFINIIISIVVIFDFFSVSLLYWSEFLNHSVKWETAITFIFIGSFTLFIIFFNFALWRLLWSGNQRLLLTKNCLRLEDRGVITNIPWSNIKGVELTHRGNVSEIIVKCNNPMLAAGLFYNILTHKVKIKDIFDVGLSEIENEIRKRIVPCSLE